MFISFITLGFQSHDSPVQVLATRAKIILVEKLGIVLNMDAK